MSEEKHTFRKLVVYPVLVIVLGTIAVALLYWACPIIWNWATAVASATWSSLNYRVSVPVWLLALLGLAAILLVVFLIVRLWRRLRTPEGPEWKDYKEDTFFQVKWRWTYLYGAIFEPACYCPRDDTALVLIRFGFVRMGSKTQAEFSCETCRADFAAPGRTEGEVRDAVIRQIDRKIRTGAWRKVVESCPRDDEG